MGYQVGPDTRMSWLVEVELMCIRSITIQLVSIWVGRSIATSGLRTLVIESALVKKGPHRMLDRQNDGILIKG